MTIQMNIGEAKSRLSELVAATERGEEVILARAGRPVAKLVVVDEIPERDRIAAQRRAFFGSLKGQIPEDIDWFQPMSDDDIALWYDAPIFPE